MPLKATMTLEQSLLEKACRAGEELAKLGLDAPQIKEKVEHAVDDGIKNARRAMKNGRHTAEELLDETTHRIKRDPLPAVAICFGAGIGLGAVIGWLSKRNGRCA